MKCETCEYEDICYVLLKTSVRFKAHECLQGRKRREYAPTRTNPKVETV